MNKVILMGRLTRDPDIRYTQGQESYCIARFNLAVDRGIRRDQGSNRQTADFPSCVAFRKTAEFIEKYCQKGTKLIVEGRLQTGSYTNRDGAKIYTTDVLVSHAEFAESKSSQGEAPQNESYAALETQRNGDQDNFMQVPDSISEDLPFN